MESSQVIKKAVIPLIAVILLAGCSSLPILNQVFKPAPQATTAGMLFEDDFSKSGSGWNHYTSEIGSTDYDHEAYHIIVNKPLVDLFATPGISYKDVVIEVKAARQSGPVNNSYGVICRYKDEDNFYTALITSDGYAGIFNVSNGKHNLLGHKEMIPVPAILGGTNVNLVHLECIGNTLALAVNGSPVDAQQDSSFTDGDAGLIAGTFDEPGVHIVFDDFKVWQP